MPLSSPLLEGLLEGSHLLYEPLQQQDGDMKLDRLTHDIGDMLARPRHL